MPDVRDFRRRAASAFDALAVGSYVAGSAVLTKLLRGSKTFDWGSIATGAQATTTVPVTGAVLGDKVLGVSMSISGGGLMFHGDVTAPDTVTVYAHNLSGGAIDLASATLSVLVGRDEASA